MPKTPATIVVDVANVMGSRPDGWWRDRAGAAVRLYDELAALAASGRATLPGDTSPGDAAPGDAAPGDAAGPPDFVMVLEGAARAASTALSSAEAARGARDAAAGSDRSTGPGRISVVEARGSGDDAIVSLVRELPGRRVVVTADRELRDRCAAAGATVLGPAWLLGLLRR